ncbi:MAG: hypothetical protein C0505_20480, partial [Leptothrix sp. (in: Bacteria)]|nr:hypothetical protein [Leptothrix sp. (in: b-proteobacteria)]
MTPKTLLAQRLLAVFAVGAVLMNFPLLRLWLGSGVLAAGTVFGLPLLPLALFSIWALLITVVALLMERGAR